MIRNTIFGKIEVKDTIEDLEKDKKTKITGWNFAVLICTKDEKELEKLKPYIPTSKYSQYLVNQALCQVIEVKFPKKFEISAWEFIKDINIMTLSNEAHFALLYNLIPQNHGYLKNRYPMVKDGVDNEIKALTWYFKEKDYIIHQYHKLISRDELNDIVDKFKIYSKQK